MKEKKLPSSSIVGVVPRLVGSSVGAAAACARRILFGQDAEKPKSVPERAEQKPKKKTTSPAKKKRKKKRAKASEKK